MSHARRRIIEQNQDVFGIRNVGLMADTYLNPVKAQVFRDFLGNAQIKLVRYSWNQGWGSGLARHHLITGIKILRKIAAQRVNEFMLPEQAQVRYAQPQGLVARRCISPNPNYEKLALRLNHTLAISHGRVLEVA